MLNIYFGRWYDIDNENYIWDPNSYFDSYYEKDWINNEISRQIIKEIDNCTVIGDHVIESPIFGLIPPQWLSGGAKLLIIINIEGEKNIYNGTKCGENCSDWLLKLSEKENITINRGYTIKFSKDNFKVKCLNDNSIISNNNELINKGNGFILDEIDRDRKSSDAWR